MRFCVNRLSDRQVRALVWILLVWSALAAGVLCCVPGCGWFAAAPPPGPGPSDHMAVDLAEVLVTPPATPATPEPPDTRPADVDPVGQTPADPQPPAAAATGCDCSGGACSMAPIRRWRRR